MKKLISLRGLLAAAILLACSQGASAASLIYDSFLTDVFSAAIAVNADTVKCMLVTSSYTPNKGTHAKRSDVTNEVVGSGYSAGGVACTVVGAVDTTNHWYTVTITGPSWAASTLTAHGMVLYKSRGGASSADNLYFYVDFGTDVSSSATTFSVTMSAPFKITN